MSCTRKAWFLKHVTNKRQKLNESAPDTIWVLAQLHSSSLMQDACSDPVVLCSRTLMCQSMIAGEVLASIVLCLFP